MASTSDAKKALETTSAPGKAVQPGDTLAAMIRTMKPEIAMALPKHMDPDRMARIATTLMRTTKDLAQCTAPSFMGALMTCAQLGLEPGPLGFAWIIPRRRKLDNGTWVMEANFQLGYKGAIELARRSGKLAKITARTVYANEVANGDFTVLYEGATETVVHRPMLLGERGKPVLYYAVARLTSGEEIFTALRPEDVESRHRRRPQAQPDSPAWKNDYESMAHKSCVVEMRRWLPQSPELEQAVAQEGRVRTDISPDVLDTPLPEFVDSTAEDVTEPDGAEIADGGGVLPPAGADESRTGWPATKRPPETAPDGTVKP
jgi:recombination protein RecT